MFGYGKAARPSLLLLIALTVAPMACNRERTPDTVRKPNVVLVTIDTLRPDHLSFYGYEDETAPFLARFAERSTVFLNAFSSSSWTAPATASLFSGQYPMKHGVIEGLQASRSRQGEVPVPMRLEINRIPAGTRTIPEILRADGYRTYGLGANPNIGPEIGFSRGFEKFDRLGTQRSTHAWAGLVYASLLGWIPEIRGGSDPYFVYLHFNDPHMGGVLHSPPVVSPDPETGRIPVYDGKIRSADEWIEKSFEALGVDDDTVVALVSDHGEAFGEAGQVGHLCCSLRREVNRILMMWSAPGLGIRAQRVDVEVSIVDVLPTLLDLLGIEDEMEVEGRSLVPILRGAEPSEAEWQDRPILAQRAEPETNQESWMIIRGRYKMHQWPSGERRLYDIREDPAESRDLSAERPEQLALLTAELGKLRARYHTRSETAPVELTVEQQERLRALGYLRD